ncbi:MAG: hypothetical protein WC001_01280 [Desulfurivibrionaceae bacterium]
MKKNDFPAQPDKIGDKNRFARHPMATISAVLLLALLLGFLSLELFLKTFSGLGNPVLYELSPLYGYRPKPNQIIEPKGGMGFLYGSRVTTNNLGLRAAGKWDNNSSGKILFLGDSVTYGGQYVSDEQLFSSVAGKSLPGWQIGNGGVNGWGIGNILGLVKSYGFTPAEIVVTCLIEEDFYRGKRSAWSVPFWYERPGSALQDLLMHFVWRVNELRYDGAIASVHEDDDHLDKIVNRASSRLQQLENYYKEKHIRHFIFILPTRNQVVNGEPADERVRLALEKYGITAKYLLPKLRAFEPAKSLRRNWFHDNVHLEPSGHSVYGTMLGKELAAALGVN